VKPEMAAVFRTVRKSTLIRGGGWRNFQGSLFAQINWLAVPLLVILTEVHGWRQARLIVAMFHACGSRHSVTQFSTLAANIDPDPSAGFEDIEGSGVPIATTGRDKPILPCADCRRMFFPAPPRASETTPRSWTAPDNDTTLASPPSAYILSTK